MRGPESELNVGLDLQDERASANGYSMVFMRQAYGQGYLTGAVLMLDLVEEYTACVNASANLCYHHTDVPYVVPEGVILHGSGQYWFRNSDLGNAVQQAEIIKEARLMLA